MVKAVQKYTKICKCAKKVVILQRNRVRPKKKNALSRSTISRIGLYHSAK